MSSVGRNFPATSPGFEMHKGQPTSLRRLAMGSAIGRLTARCGGSGGGHPSYPAPRPPLQRCSPCSWHRCVGMKG